MADLRGKEMANMRRTVWIRVLAVVLLAILSVFSVACESSYGVGVSYPMGGYYSPWGGPWHGGVYVGGPVVF